MPRFHAGQPCQVGTLVKLIWLVLNNKTKWVGRTQPLYLELGWELPVSILVRLLGQHQEFLLW